MADEAGPSEAAATSSKLLACLKVLVMVALGAVAEYIRQNGLPF